MVVSSASLEADRVATTNGATTRHGSIHADFDMVLFCRRAQDARIHREIALRQGGHHTAPAMTCDAEAHGRTDGKRAADPGILRKAHAARNELQHDVRTKPPDFEATLWIHPLQAVKRGRGQ